MSIERSGMFYVIYERRKTTEKRLWHTGWDPSSTHVVLYMHLLLYAPFPTAAPCQRATPRGFPLAENTAAGKKNKLLPYMQVEVLSTHTQDCLDPGYGTQESVKCIPCASFRLSETLWGSLSPTHSHFVVGLELEKFWEAVKIWRVFIGLGYRVPPTDINSKVPTG